MANMTALERCKHFGVANIQGMAYMPGPSNYSKTAPPGSLYEDSDFYNNIFHALWGFINPNERGRRDFGRFQQQLGVNFIHCYDWAAPVSQIDENGQLRHLRTHVGFLASAAQDGMKATVPISNYTMQLLSEGRTEEARKNVGQIIPEVYSAGQPIAGVGMWKIFNEYELWFDRNPAHVVTAMKWIAEWEATSGITDANALPVMVCTSFGMEDGIEGAGFSGRCGMSCSRRARSAKPTRPRSGTIGSCLPPTRKTTGLISRITCPAACPATGIATAFRSRP